MKPTYRVRANDADITATIAQRFLSLRLTDEAGLESDLLEIILADDPAAPIAMPTKGAELEVWLGYDGQATRMGLYVCDEISLEGPPDQMCIRARAATYEGTPKGKKDLQTQKTRSWEGGTIIGAMVKTMAREHGMTAAVSPSLANIALPHTDQTEESDISLLVRLARRYDAIAKPSGGKLVFARRGESKTISGEALPTIALTRQDVTRWGMTSATREAPGTVVAFWHSVRGATRQLVSVGSGEPVRRLRHWYPTEAAARSAAEAELQRRQRGENTLRLTLPGRPDLQAEGRLLASGFRDGIDAEWLMRSVEHSLDAGMGYVCSVECEQPSESDPAPDSED